MRLAVIFKRGAYAPMSAVFSAALCNYLGSIRRGDISFVADLHERIVLEQPIVAECLEREDRLSGVYAFFIGAGVYAYILAVILADRRIVDLKVGSVCRTYQLFRFV